MATLIVIGMLMAVVLALSHYQAIARRTYMQEEASLRFREGMKFEVRRQLLNIAPPSGLLVGAAVTNTTPAGTSQLGSTMAKNIFDRAAGLPDLRNIDKSSAHEVLKLTPSTPDVGLRVFGSNSYGLTISRVPGYAAFAPQGGVNITNLEGWANPTFDDPRPSSAAFSGVKAVAAGRTLCTVTNATYAEAYCNQGNARVDHGNGIAFRNQWPLRPYQEALFSAAISARDQLRNNAASGDKTLSLVSTSTGPEAIIDLFFGGGTGLQQFLSLRNANHFWMPMIPSFSPSPPYLYQFAFSVPWPPDNASYSDGTQVGAQLDALGQQLATAGKALEKAKKDLDKAQQEYNDDPSASRLAALNTATSVWNSAKSVVEDLTQQMGAITGPQKSQIEAQAASGMRGVPPTRSQDPSGDSGQTGWNYSKAGDLLADLIGFLFSFDPKKLASACSNPDVDLVHFGGPDRPYQFELNESQMTLDATLTVPRGRTLRLSSPEQITIVGDLWLQRGSTFVANTNRLLVVPGRGSDSSKFFSPNGRIFLEEGATLICSGDVECVGSTSWGSVVVGGVPGKIRPITAGIFARRVQLNNGIFAGCALDDLLEGLGVNQATLKSINDDFMRPLMANIAPNAAKVIGPFWPRKPYFAQYATTFQIICPPIPPFGVPGPPIPTPIPLPSKNVLVPIARGLSYVYSVTLNLSLGENFCTHSDWWVFGEGVVPMVPQVSPTKVIGSIGNFASAALDALNPENIIKEFVEAVVKDMVEYVVKEVVVAVVEKVALEVIPYAGLVGMATSLLTDITSNLVGRETKRDSAGSSLTSALTAAVSTAAQNTLGNLSSKFSTTVENEFLREYNGLMIFADDSITIGGNMATGFFMARNNINITSKNCVGSLLSQNGSINCQHLMFYPYFNRASFYVPKATPDDWFLRALEFGYDAAYSSNTAVDVGPPAIPPVISSQGWAQ